MNTMYSDFSAALAEDRRSRLRADADRARLVRIARDTRRSTRSSTGLFRVPSATRILAAFRRPVVIGTPRTV